MRQYVFGPVPSRRLGSSLGVSPIPNKTCNYSCIYCQLGRTNSLMLERKDFYRLDEIMEEMKSVLESGVSFDVITIVGEGEPTLYSELGELILSLKGLTEKPVVVITNGALLADAGVRNELMSADIVMPSLDATSPDQFKKINRPHKKIDFNEVVQGLIAFSKVYEGHLWMEIMFVEGYNDDEKTLAAYKKILSQITYERLYLNAPVRPPAEADVREVSAAFMKRAETYLGGLSIDLLYSEKFFSEIADDFDAILSIIRRHPMTEFEITEFLKSRNCGDIERIFTQLSHSHVVQCIDYKGYKTYRLNN